MPFIRGRYHINPTMGDALEAAREAEAALLALEQQARQERDSGEDDADSDDDSAVTSDRAPAGPIHRVEVEAAEVVPSHTGRAARGFVARVHRAPAAASAMSSSPRLAPPPPPETHVFSDHRDLVNFLGQEFAKDAGQRG
jgi:hypothetical protein